MAIDALLEQLRREAALEAIRIEETAAREAEAVLAAARIEVATRRDTEIARLANARRGVVRRGLAGAEREARSRWLEARSAAVDRVFAAAGRMLADLAPDGYRDRLPDLIEEALRYLPPEGTVLSCPPSIAAEVRAMIGDQSPIRIDADPSAPPGVIATGDGGRVMVDGSLPGRLERHRPDWAILVAARLSGATDETR